MVLGGWPVLRDLELTVVPGEVVAVTGANGSGKSTLLRVLAGLLRPTSGRLELAPHLSTPGAVTLVGHDAALHPDLTLAENLSLVARLTARDDDDVTRVLTDVGLHAAAGRRARSCSAGMRRRAELARAALCEPRLLLLDEAHAALDGRSRFLVASLARAVADSGGAVVLVTHRPEEVLDVATRVVHLDGGRLQGVGR